MIQKTFREYSFAILLTAHSVVILSSCTSSEDASAYDPTMWFRVGKCIGQAKSNGHDLCLEFFLERLDDTEDLVPIANLDRTLDDLSKEASIGLCGSEEVDNQVFIYILDRTRSDGLFDSVFLGPAPCTDTLPQDEA